MSVRTDDPSRPVGDVHRPITVRLPNEALAELQFVSAAIRRSTGAALGSSAIVRGLIAWLAETDVDTRRIRTPEDLRCLLLAAVRGEGRRGARRPGA